MLPKTKIPHLFVTTVCVAVASVAAAMCAGGCKHEPTIVHADSATLLPLIRAYGLQPTKGTVLAAGRETSPTQPAPSALQTEEDYRSQVRLFFSQNDFDQLESLAREAREQKGRVAGGSWKLISFHDGISTTYVKQNSDDADWQVYLSIVNKWIAAKPQSIEARNSLAEAYLGCAWFARGSDYAGSVSSGSWRLFHDRVGKAADTLAEAARLNEKSPYWFEVLQVVALAQGWSKPDSTELLERSIAFEPHYYHFYREHANYLQPKWYGEEGELEAWATETADRVGGEGGDMIYFEIASLAACQCDAEKNVLQNYSWERIKSGYSAIRRNYGDSNRKANRFASMAYKEQDKGAAQLGFAVIGDKWSSDVWMNRETFDTVEAWAGSQ